MLVYHADWSSAARGRWAVRATTSGDHFLASAPEPVGDLTQLLQRLRTADGPVVVGFDFPIGVPRAWADAAGVSSFPALLPRLGHDEWSRFYDLAETPGEIGLRRPFYPRRPGGARVAHLEERLGLPRSELMRRCDRGGADGRAACPLFWTLGANQVGRGALTGWRAVLAPALAGGDVALWPFDGPLDELLERSTIVVTETYPAAFYNGFGLRGAKSAPLDRAANADALRNTAARLDVALDPELVEQLIVGFAGDDPYDAFVGLLGMIEVLRGQVDPGEPRDDERVVRVEGWMLGR